MYDWPQMQADNDAFWTILKNALNDYGFQNLPPALTRDYEPSSWSEGNIALTQTCGYPLKHELGSTVELLGTPVYDVEYCRDGLYSSVILVRKDDKRTSFQDFQGAIPAVNSLNSQSGYNAFRNFTHTMKTNATSPFFSTPIISGGHSQSISAVARQQADICAIDPVSWQLAQRFQADAAQLQVIANTPYTPALPLVCSTSIARHFSGSLGCGPEGLRKTIVRAWQDAINANPTIAQNLFLKAITFIERDAYLSVPTLTFDNGETEHVW